MQQPPGPPGGYPPPPGGYPPAPGGYPPAPGGYQQAPGAPGGPTVQGGPAGGGYAGGYPAPGGPPPNQPMGGGYPGAPGAPPGFGGPPGGPGYPGAPGGFGQGMRNPPPKKSGGNVPLMVAMGCGGLVVLSLIVGVLIVAFGSSDDPVAETSSTPPTKTPDKPTKTPLASNNWHEMSAPPLKFRVPAGWTDKKEGDWGVLRAKDGKAVLAFVMFNRPRQSTTLLGKAARILRVGRVHWKGSPNRTILGKDKFPSVVGTGWCQFHGRGKIEYATVNPGGRDQLLILYTVAADASKKHMDAVAYVMSSLQLK